MRILINGLGCPFTGSRYVLEQIIDAAPDNVDITVILPIVYGQGPFCISKKVRTINLRHHVWGMYMRIFIELYCNFLMWTRQFDKLINLSNYGLCLSRRQLLYIHNPHILNMSASQKFGQGNPN